MLKVLLKLPTIHLSDLLMLREKLTEHLLQIVVRAVSHKLSQNMAIFYKLLIADLSLLFPVGGDSYVASFVSVAID